MEVALPPDLEQFIKEQVESGRYGTVGDVVCDALGLLKERESARQERLEALRDDIAVGVAQADRGEVAPLDIEEIKAQGRQRLARGRDET